MEVLRIKENSIELGGSASEFSSLARVIKKSKVNHQFSVDVTGHLKTIQLICTKTVTSIDIDHCIKISFTEETKNYLHGFISVPFDASLGSQFTLNPIDHEGIFIEGSMSMVININEAS